jgi:hypothetical protein
MKMKITTFILILIFLCSACSMKRKVKTGLMVGAGVALGLYVGSQLEDDSSDSSSKCDGDMCSGSGGGVILLLFGWLGGALGFGADLITTPKEKNDGIPEKTTLNEPFTITKDFGVKHYGR